MSVINQWPVSLPLIPFAQLPTLDVSQAGALAYCTDALDPTTGFINRTLIEWSGTLWVYHNTGLQVRTSTAKATWLLDICRKNSLFLSLYNFLQTFEDFSFINANNIFAASYSATVAGTGANIAEFAPTAVTEVGIADLNTGSTAAGRSTLATGLVLWSPTRVAYFGCKARISNASSATDRYTVRLGFGDSITAAENTDGAFFRYTDNVNANQIQCVTRSNNVETVFNTNIAMPVVFTKFEVLLNADGTANFYINNGGVSINQGGAPTTVGRELGVVAIIFKSVGTAFRSLYLDYMTHAFEIGAR